MEWLSSKSGIISFLKKYRYVALVLLLGILLMLLPEKRTEELPNIPAQTEEKPELEERLEMILGKISGVGKVAVLLTQAYGTEMHYQTDADAGASQQRSETVLITGADRAQEGLIRRVDPPVYLGAVVVCQGADNAAVRLSVVDAVSSATGLSTDRITVVKMK